MRLGDFDPRKFIHRLMHSSTQPLRTQIKTTPDRSPDQIKNEFLKAFEGTTIFSMKKREILDLLNSYCPTEFTELQTLAETHKEGFIQQLIQGGGWKTVKQTQLKAMNTPINGCSMQDFRLQMVKAVTNLCLAAVREMGFDPPGKHSASGTPGADSDIDTVYIAPNEIPEKVQIVHKLLFDTIFYAMFNTSSGTLLDTECYLNHAASSLQTEKYLSTPKGKSQYAAVELLAVALQFLMQYGSTEHPKWNLFKENLSTPKGKSQYAAVELLAVALQFLMQYGSTEHPKWNLFKEKMITCASKEIQIGLSTAFGSIEETENFIRKGINTQIILDDRKRVSTGESSEEIAQRAISIKEKKPEAEELATINFKTQVLLRIAGAMDTAKDQLKRLDQQLIRTPQTDLDKIQEITVERERLHIKLASLALLRNRFFDEAYNSQGAFKVICSGEEGQIHKGQVQKYRREVAKEIQAQGVTRIEPKQEYSLSSEQTETANNLQNMMSALENLVYYKSHFDHALAHLDSEQVTSYQTTVISVSKYSERILDGLLKILESIKKTKQLTPQEESFVKKAEKSYFVASELEKIKRKKQLNKTTTIQLFKEALKKATGKEISKEQLEQLDLIFSQSERRGSIHELRLEPAITEREFYLSQMKALADSEIITLKDSFDQDGNVLSTNEEINAIMRARCLSEDTPSPAVKEILKRSREISLETYELTSIEAIEQFNTEIEDLTLETYNLAVKYKVLSMPSENMESSFNLPTLSKTLVRQATIKLYEETGSNA